ncbi:MAG TPA: hypothetical protein VFV68_00465, partial [Agriterribacter sp.]|nr:hypothetical protein [Agriterribacter sp.]
MVTKLDLVLHGLKWEVSLHIGQDSFKEIPIDHRKNLIFMSVVVVGSMAFDAIETPFGKSNKIVGGAATYIAW